MRFRPGRLFRRPGPLRMGPRLFGPRSPAWARAGRSALGVEPRRRLEQAHRLLAEGHPAAAAPIFAELARAAESFGMPQRAAHLYLQAARCLLQIGDSSAALGPARAALDRFVAVGMGARALEIYRSLVQDMRARGMSAEADGLQREVEAKLGPVEASAATQQPAKPRGHLPAKCAGCGGPVRSHEVE